MSVQKLLRDSIIVYKHVPEGSGADVDVFGNPQYELDAGTTVRANVIPRRAREDENDRETRVTTWLVTVGPEVNVEGIDAIVWSGNLCRVMGRPFDFFTRFANSSRQRFIMRLDED